MKHIYSLTAIIIATVVLGVQVASASSLDNVYSQYDDSDSTQLETVYSNEYDSYDLTQSEGKVRTTRKLKSSFELDYNLFTDQVSVGGTLVLEGLVFTGEYGSFTNLATGVKSNTSWSAGFGLNKRIYILDFLYVDGRLGANYCDIVTTYEDSYEPVVSSDDEPTGKWGGFANVRAGLRLINNTCVNFGSKWKFSEFNLTEDYRSSYYYIGVTFLF